MRCLLSNAIVFSLPLSSLLAIIKYFLNQPMCLYLFFPDEGAFQHFVTFEEPHGYDGRFYGPNGLCYAQDDGEHRYVAHKHIPNLLQPRKN